MKNGNAARVSSCEGVFIKCNVFSCEKIYDAKTELSSLKTSNRFKVCLVTSGEGIHRVLDCEIPCSVGDICIIPPDVPHGYFLNDGAGELSVRQLEFDIRDWFSADVTERESPNYCYGVFAATGVIAYATLNSYMLDRVYLLYDYIECESLERKSGWAELIRSYLTDLFINVARYINLAIKTSFPITAGEWGITASAMKLINERYTDSAFTMGSVAEELYVSESRLSRLFKRATGVSFPSYLRSVRVSRVCELLLKSDMNVEDAARSCGFLDMNTFYEVFSRAVGMTPGKYRKTKTQKTKIISKDKKEAERERLTEILGEISENLQKGKAKLVKELVAAAIAEGGSPEQILNEGLLAGMRVVGDKFKNNEVYVPEVLVAARAMNMGAEVLKPYLAASGAVTRGKVCIGTVAGDLHDIGKNLVKMMMEGKGLEVIDLGTDVSAETFVNTAESEGCKVICCSALLTTTVSVMEEVVKLAKERGIRDKVRIMIGGAPVSQEYCDKIGADLYTVDAASAADAAVDFLKKQNNG